MLCHIKNCYGKSYGCGIVGGRIGGWGIEGMADRVVRNGIRDGLGVSVAFTSIACPFLYTVKVMLFPRIVLTNVVDNIILFVDIISINSYYYMA